MITCPSPLRKRRVCFLTTSSQVPTSSNIFQHLPTSSNISFSFLSEPQLGFGLAFLDPSTPMLISRTSPGAGKSLDAAGSFRPLYREIRKEKRQKKNKNRSREKTQTDKKENHSASALTWQVPQKIQVPARHKFKKQS